jgi:hypothetical protein
MKILDEAINHWRKDMTKPNSQTTPPHDNYYDLEIVRGERLGGGVVFEAVELHGSSYGGPMMFRVSTTYDEAYAELVDRYPDTDLVSESNGSSYFVIRSRAEQRSADEERRRTCEERRIAVTVNAVRKLQAILSDIVQRPLTQDEMARTHQHVAAVNAIFDAE